MKTLKDLHEAVQEAHRSPFSNPLMEVDAKILGRITKSIVKDGGAHVAHMATAVGASSPAEVPLTVLTAEFPDEVDAQMAKAGKREALRRNCKTTATLFCAIAVALGHVKPTPEVPKMPKRKRLTQADETGRRVDIRGKLNEAYEPYAANPADLPADVQAGIARMKHHYTASIVFGRKKKPMAMATWLENEGRILRFFGALRLQGSPLDQARLEDLIDPEKLEVFGNFFIGVHGVATYTLHGYWVWAANVAANFYKNKAVSDAIWGMINQVRWQRVNDNDEKIQRITADDLWHVADCLHDCARAYYADNFHKRPGKALLWPKAMVAFHVGRALLFHLSLVTWLRRRNLVQIVYGQHLYKHDGRLWFAFTAEEMKAKEPHAGQVRDLWRGQAGLKRVEELLTWYLELRPFLVERYMARHPGAAEPETLFLNKYGAPYGKHAAWGLYSASSRQYLDEGKEFSPHNVRHILASRVLLKYGYPIFSHVQALLAHKSSNTTELYYARVKLLLGAEEGQAVIDAQADQAQQGERMRRMEAKLDAVLQGDLAAELRELLEEIKQQLPPSA